MQQQLTGSLKSSSCLLATFFDPNDPLSVEPLTKLLPAQCCERAHWIFKKNLNQNLCRLLRTSS